MGSFLVLWFLGFSAGLSVGLIIAARGKVRNRCLFRYLVFEKGNNWRTSHVG